VATEKKAKKFSASKAIKKMAEESAKKKKEKPAKIIVAKPVKYLATKEEAGQRTAHIKEVFQSMGKMWWSLGSEVKKAIEDRVPEALGRSAHEWMTDCFGDGWLKIYRAHRIMKAMTGVEMKKLEQISEGNAYVLSRLPEKTRKDPAWLKKAVELNNDDFKAAAEKFVAKKTGISDPMVPVKEALGFSTIPTSLRDIMKVTIKAAAAIMGADLDEKKGRLDVVEAIFAEYQLNHQGQPSKLQEDDAA
jgi:hypothetical protein